MKGKRTGTLFIIVGVLLAVVVGGLVYALTSQTALTAEGAENVVVAAQEIPERTVIPANAVVLKKVPVSVVPTGAVKKPEEVIGRMSVEKIHAGELVLTSNLADTKGQSGISFTLERGKVLLTFPSSNIVGIGMVRPGDSVDLLVTYKPPASTSSNQAQGTAGTVAPNVTQTTMQNLKVVTIGAATEPSGQRGNQTNTNLVTFAMDPQDALFLKAIKDAEDLVIEMALRAAADTEIHKTEPVSFQDVLDRYEINAPTGQSTSRR
mgnify:CR=1 FL=1